ncbi:MAG TPA: non-canonical purine NTP pyrophosphatase [Methylomirabilota bacterium]|nr:non-canonical purine NTP pyrophosphatase [Methylomirabilota bacterium]
MTTLLLATRNAHKADEIRAILGGNFRCLTLDDFIGAPQVAENADSFAGNATKKAVELAHWLAQDDTKFQTRNSKLEFVLADDSGLKVDALNGAPGVHSARFAAMDSGKPGNSSDADNNSKLLRLLEKVPAEKRTARFRCVIALTTVPTARVESASPVCFSDEFETQIFDGVCKGKIILQPRGKNGFGYDPLFVPEGCEQTFAELGDEEKNKISHRAKALEKVRDYLSKLPS